MMSSLGVDATLLPRMILQRMIPVILFDIHAGEQRAR
jgi:hypothetical protein